MNILFKSGFFSICLVAGFSFFSVYPSQLGSGFQHSIQLKKARKLHRLIKPSLLTGRMKENFSQSEIYMELDPKGTPHGMFYAIDSSNSRERISGFGVFEDGQPANITKFGDNGSRIILSYSQGGRLVEISFESEGKTVTQQFNLAAEKPLRNLQYENAPELNPYIARSLQTKIDRGEYPILHEIMDQIPATNTGLASALADSLGLPSPRTPKESYMQFLATETSDEKPKQSLYPTEMELAESLPEKDSYSLNAHQSSLPQGSFDISNPLYPDFSAPEIKSRRILRKGELPEK